MSAATPQPAPAHAHNTWSSGFELSTRVFVGLLVLGILFRALGLLTTPNYDMDSYGLVADLVLDGENVYASTERYNYSPVWFLILAALRMLLGDALRLGVWVLLTLTDVSIATIIRKRVGDAAALFFFFSPWSILVTGQYNQFDNIAVLLALLMLRYIESRVNWKKEGRLSGLSIRETSVAASLLAASLLVKHVFIFFPFWMAFRVKGWNRKMIWALLPLALFGLSFLPFAAEADGGIMRHVFNYDSANNAPFLNTFAPGIFSFDFLSVEMRSLAQRGIYLGAMLLAGIVLARRPLIEAFLFYTALMVLLSAGVHAHYFAIPLLFVAAWRNIWSWIYSAAGLPFMLLCAQCVNLPLPAGSFWAGITAFNEPYGKQIVIVLLALSVATVIWRDWLRRTVIFLTERVRDALRGVD